MTKKTETGVRSVMRRIAQANSVMRVGVRDRLAMIGCLALLIVSAAAVWGYDRDARAGRLEERMYSYEKNHEKVYSSLHMFVEQLQAVHRELLLNRDVSEWLNHSQDLISDMYRLSVIQNTFARIVNNHSGLASVHLHNKTNDLVLSTSFMLSSLRDFPDREIFEEFYERRTNFVWKPLISGSENNASGQNLIAAVFGMPNQGKNGAVAIQVSERYIAEQIMDGNEYMIWLDGEDRPLVAKNPQSLRFFQENREHILNVKQSSFVYKDHFVIFSVSEEGNWKLVTVMPESVLADGSAEQQPFAYLVLFLVMATGLLTFLYLRHTRRLQNLNFESKMRQGLEDFRKGFIADLLTGKPVRVDKAKEYGIDLAGCGFQVAVLQIDNYYNYLLGRSDQERLFTNKIIFNAIRWTFALKFNAYIVNTDYEKIAVLLCYDTISESVSIKLDETIRYLQEDIRANFGLTLCAGVSEIVDDVANVPDCYAHALRALEYKTVYGKQSLIHYGKLPQQKNIPAVLAADRVQRIAEELQQGRLDRIEAILDEELQNLISEGLATPDGIQVFFANVMSILMKFVIERRIDLNEVCGEDVFLTLISYEFLEEKRDYVLNVCCKLIERTAKPSGSGAMAKLVADYLDKHFDKPISLNILADKLSMSPSYLSVFIKNHFGVGFVEYINRLRIQKALKLLENDKLTIQQIAEQCGYDTVHTFIRQFKKLYSMPPNEYRKKLTAEKM